MVSTITNSPTSISVGEAVRPSERIKPIVLRGRDITFDDIDAMKAIIEENWSSGRSQISRLICKSLGWHQNNGRLKERACRDVLRSLEQMNLLKLPPSRLKRTAPVTHRKHSLPDNHLLSSFHMASVSINSITSLSVVMVRWTKEEELWNSLVATYHYLGYTLIVGRHLKYIVYEKDIPVACLGWGDAAWHIKDRDSWIRWTPDERCRNIKFIINNVRFLILPWVKVPNFGSFILSRCIKVVTQDWERYYGVRPILLETFVEKDRFKGTCYRAANWIHVGTTKGYARHGYSYHNHQIPKDIYLYPLHPNVRELLKS